ncbi:MAG: hypothetical protein HKM95_17050 [Inquilinus sp.]|nr:hypothetical protein [Inquilinus sp.]
MPVVTLPPLVSAECDGRNAWFVRTGFRDGIRFFLDMRVRLFADVELRSSHGEFHDADCPEAGLG